MRDAVSQPSLDIEESYLSKKISLNYIKQNRLKDTLWKREGPSKMALANIASLMLPGTTMKGEGFYVKPFLIRPFPLEW